MPVEGPPVTQQPGRGASLVIPLSVLRAVEFKTPRLIVYRLGFGSIIGKHKLVAPVGISFLKKKACEPFPPAGTGFADEGSPFIHKIARSGTQQ